MFNTHMNCSRCLANIYLEPKVAPEAESPPREWKLGTQGILCLQCWYALTASFNQSLEEFCSETLQFSIIFPPRPPFNIMP